LVRLHLEQFGRQASGLSGYAQARATRTGVGIAGIRNHSTTMATAPRQVLPGNDDGRRRREVRGEDAGRHGFRGISEH
jgi:hypothetical protein